MVVVVVVRSRLNRLCITTIIIIIIVRIRSALHSRRTHCRLPRLFLLLLLPLVLYEGRRTDPMRLWRITSGSNFCAGNLLQLDEAAVRSLGDGRLRDGGLFELFSCIGLFLLMMSMNT